MINNIYRDNGESNSPDSEYFVQCPHCGQYTMEQLSSNIYRCTNCQYEADETTYEELCDIAELKKIDDKLMDRELRSA